MSRGKKYCKDCAGNEWFTEDNKLMRRDRNGKCHHESNIGPKFTDADLKTVVKHEDKKYRPARRSR